MTRQNPQLPRGLVYMDAMGDLEDDPPADAEWLSLQQQLPPGLTALPACPPLDRSSFETFRSTWGCRLGFEFPLAELHSMFEDDGGKVGTARMPDWAMRAMGQGQSFRKDYANIRVPVLALMQFGASADEILTATKYRPANAAEREAIDRFAARSRVVFDRWIAKLTRQVPNARIVNLGQVGHYVFLTRETEILRELHTFIAALPAESGAVR
jgi:hypothetical protein